MLQTQTYRPASLGRQLSILTSPSPVTKLNDSASQVSQVDSPSHHYRKTSENFSRPQSSLYKKPENASPANKTLRSTQPGSPISDMHKRVSPAAPKALVIQRSNSMSMYNTLKDHKKNMFINSSRNYEDLKTTSSGIESPKNAIRIVMTTNEPQPPQNGFPGNSILNFSPRKKLFLQGDKGPAKKKKMTMKELLVRSSSISVKPTSTFLTSPSFSQKKSSPPKNEIEINLQEEEQGFENIDKQFKASFDKKIDIYNKFYTAYLLDPEMEFNTREDLKVKVDSFVSPKNALTEGTTQFKTTKHMHTMFTKSPLISNKKSEDFGSFALYADKAMTNNVGENTPQLKLSKTFTSKSKLREITASPTLEVKKTTVEDRVTSIEKMFSEGREKAEEWTQGLVDMQEVLQKAGNLNEEQETFVSRIKEGKLFIVEAMAKKNPNLISMRDPSNQTPLHWAVKRNQAAIVELLCQQGADVEAVDLVGRTPFDIAKRFSNHKVVQALEAGREQQQIKKKLKIRSKLLKLGSLRTAVKVVRKIKQPIS